MDFHGCFNLSDNTFMFLYDNSRSIAIRDKIKFISQPLKRLKSIESKFYFATTEFFTSEYIGIGL